MSSEMLEIKKNKLYFEGYFYVRDKICDETVYWKCEDFNKGCRGRIISKKGVLTTKNDQIHPGKAEKLDVVNVMEEITSKAVSSHDSPQLILSEATKNASESTTARLPAISVIKRRVQKIRQKENPYPSTPQCIGQFVIGT